MNQATNLIQYKNHSDEQKADFDFKNYQYQVQLPNSIKWQDEQEGYFRYDRVYRLKIEPDKYYACGYDDAIFKGSYLSEVDISEYSTLRPAKSSEIPKTEKTLEDRIEEEWPDYKVVMLLWWKGHNEPDRLRIPIGNSACYDHIEAPSYKGFYFYVYEKDNGLLRYSTPTKNWNGKTVHPVAVLFEEGE